MTIILRRRRRGIGDVHGVKATVVGEERVLACRVVVTQVAEQPPNVGEETQTMELTP